VPLKAVEIKKTDCIKDQKRSQIDTYEFSKASGKHDFMAHKQVLFRSAAREKYCVALLNSPIPFV
jgi:hypothetical protein